MPRHIASENTPEIRHARLEVRILPDEERLLGRFTYELDLRAPLDSLLILHQDVEIDSVYASLDTLRSPVSFRAHGNDSAYVDFSGMMNAGMPVDSALNHPGMPVDSALNHPGMPVDSALNHHGIQGDSTLNDPAMPGDSILNHAGIPVDSTLNLTIVFRGKSARFDERGAWFAGSPLPWFPWPGDPGDRFTANLTITVPDGWTAVAPGLPTARRSTADGRQTYLFVSPHRLPAARYGFIAGDFDQAMAFAALPGGRQVAVQRFGGEAPGRAAEMLAHLSEWTGLSYPFSHYYELSRQDLEPAAGAQIGTVPAWSLDGYGWDADLHPEFEAALPVAEQWFGVITGPDSWADVWLGDGLSTLAAADYAAIQGDTRVFQHLRDAYFAEAPTHPRPLAWDRFYHPAELTDPHTRARGAWVIKMLRDQVGAEAFATTIRQLLSEAAFASISTHDFLAALEHNTDLDVDRFAADWIYGTGHPVLQIEYGADGSTLTLRIEQLQDGEEVAPAFRLSTQVMVGTLAGEERFDVVIDDRSDVVTLPVSGQPRYVAIDPKGAWLMEASVSQSPSALVAQLREASEPGARIAAAEAIRTAGSDPALLLGLRAALSGETSPWVRAAILSAIATHAPSAAAERALIAAFEDSSSVVRGAALAGLTYFSESDAPASMAIRAAQEAGRPFLQAQAVRTLAELGDPRAVDVARSALITPSPDGVIPAAGLDALVRLHPLAPGAAYEAALEYSGPGHTLRVRRAAIRLLGALAGVNRNARDRLIELVDASHPSIRIAAAEALFASGQSGSLPAQSLRADVAAYLQKQSVCP